MRHVPAMDATALQSFKLMVEKVKKRKIKLLVSSINTQPMNLFIKSGLIEKIGEENIFLNREKAYASANTYVV